MSVPFTLHLLRHGAPVTEGLLLGRTDAAPTAAGIALCRARVAGLGPGDTSPVEPGRNGTRDRPGPIEALISSDLARAALAAQAIGRDLRLAPTVDPRWRELDFGDWDGLAPDAIDPTALARLHDTPDACPPPGGERWSGLLARVAAAIIGLPPRRTLVVTHAGAMRAALAVLCGFDHHQVWAIDLPCAALLSLRIWPGERPMAQITALAA